MRNGTMFGSLGKYLDESYAKNITKYMFLQNPIQKHTKYLQYTLP